MPFWFKTNPILHYYGDPMRRLFVVAALIFVIAVPLWGDLLPFGENAHLLQIAIAIGLVILAGLTNPRSIAIFAVTMVAAALGTFLLEASAISFFPIDSFLLFSAREVAAIVLLFALYFSVKTLRAMMVGSIGGKRDVLKKQDQKE